MRRSEIERLLPEVFQRTMRPGGPLFSIVEIMETQHRPSEEILEQLDAYFHPFRTPDEFVPYLAQWVDLGRLLAEAPEGATTTVPFPTGIFRLRALVSAAAYLSQWRGTATGLIRFLETATGVSGFEIDERVTRRDGRVRPYHILVRAPAETEQYRSLIQLIIDLEKPAHVTYSLEFVG
jgi:phage tail-like protein